MFNNIKKLRAYRKIEQLNQKKPYHVSKDGRGIIDLSISDWNNGVFSSYSVLNNVMDSSLEEYINHSALDIPLNLELELNIYENSDNKKDQEKFISTFRSSYQKNIGETNRKLKTNLIFSISMLVTAVLFFGIYLFIHKNFPHYITDAMLEIACWVFTWEAVNQFFIERKLLRFEQIKNYRLKNSNIIFKRGEGK